MINSDGCQLVHADAGCTGRVLERNRFVLVSVRERNSLRANQQHKQNCANGSTELLWWLDHKLTIMTPNVAISAAFARPRQPDRPLYRHQSRASHSVSQRG